eukprot:TRINITY_DN3302_c0_g1_i1.p1 TRINITY_DN3302_c0_g1~~TRINITY_DN3302_c0_g1_i1.p1  ORF type:complete len:460 (+),score=80.40 TRINITY_DN3302_c0_g1_i1:53-1432(+)
MRSSACTFFAFVPLILVPGHAERTEALAMEESEQLVDDALAAASLTELFVGASRNLTGCLSDSEKTFIRAEAAAAARAEAAATLRAESVAAARSGVASAHGEAAPTPCGEAIATARAEAAAAARAEAAATLRAEAAAAARTGVASARADRGEAVATSRAKVATAARHEAAATARAQAAATAGQPGTMRFDPAFDSYAVGANAGVVDAVATARSEAAAVARAEAAAKAIATAGQPGTMRFDPAFDSYPVDAKVGVDGAVATGGATSVDIPVAIRAADAAAARAVGQLPRRETQIFENPHAQPTHQIVREFEVLPEKGLARPGVQSVHFVKSVQIPEHAHSHGPHYGVESTDVVQLPLQGDQLYHEAQPNGLVRFTDAHQIRVGAAPEAIDEGVVEKGVVQDVLGDGHVVDRARPVLKQLPLSIVLSIVPSKTGLLVPLLEKISACMSRMLSVGMSVSTQT